MTFPANPTINGFEVLNVWQEALMACGAICECHHLAWTHLNDGLCRMNRDICGCKGLKIVRLDPECALRPPGT